MNIIVPCIITALISCINIFHTNIEKAWRILAENSSVVRFLKIEFLWHTII